MRIDVHSGRSPLVAAAVVLTVALAWRTPARAYHDERTLPVDDTAYTLRQGEFQLGVLFQHIGVLPRVQLDFVLAGYMLGAFTDVFLPNLSAKLRIFDLGQVSFGASVGLAYARFRPSSPETGTRADLAIVPASLYLSWRPARAFIGSIDFSGTWVKSLAGTDDVATSDELQGAATVSSFSTGANLIFPLTRVFALTVGGRVLLYQTPVTVSSNTRVDSHTNVELNGEVTVENADFAWQVVPGAFFSWGTFNLRAGLGYGSFFLPRLGLVVPKKTIVPELEASFRF
jgi:hypothetical protein